MRFTFTGASPDELANGRPLAFGDVVELTRQQQRANARLIDAERLRPMPRRRRPKTNQETE